MTNKTIYTDDTVDVCTTGMDFDFIAYIVNKAAHDILIHFDDCVEDAEISVPAGDWTGILADDTGYGMLSMLRAGNWTYAAA